MLHAESCWFFFFLQSLFISQNQHSPIFSNYLLSGGFSLHQLNWAPHVVCKHIRVACLSVGFIYSILETTLFQGSVSPQVTSLSDIPESTSHRVHLWLTFTKCTVLIQNQERQVFLFLKEKWVRRYRCCK